MPKLNEHPVNIRIVLAALWTSVMFCYIYCDYFELYVPGKTEGLVSGSNMLDSPMKLLAAAVLLAIPSLLICLTVLLPAAWSRTLNIVFGIFFTLMMLLIAVTSLTAWRMFYVFFALVESLLTMIITWYAWKKWDFFKQ